MTAGCYDMDVMAERDEADIRRRMSLAKKVNEYVSAIPGEFRGTDYIINNNWKLWVIPLRTFIALHEAHKYNKQPKTIDAFMDYCFAGCLEAVKIIGIPAGIVYSVAKIL